MQPGGINRDRPITFPKFVGWLVIACAAYVLVISAVIFATIEFPK